MSAKTYVPGLILILKAAHKYMTRYQNVLSTTLSPEAYTCMLDSITALASCLALITPPPRGD